MNAITKQPPNPVDYSLEYSLKYVKLVCFFTVI